MLTSEEKLLRAIESHYTDEEEKMIIPFLKKPKAIFYPLDIKNPYDEFRKRFKKKFGHYPHECNHK